MPLDVVIGIVALAFWLVMAAGVVLATVSATRRQPARAGVIVALIGLVGGLVVSAISAGLVDVRSNEIAVIYRRIGGDDDALVDAPLRPGLRWVIPFVDEAIIYSTSRQTVDMSVSQGNPVVALTKDGQQVTVDVTVIFALDPAHINQLHTRWQGNYISGLVVPVAREEVRDQISAREVQEVYQLRSDLGSQIEESMRPRLQEEELLLIDVLVRNIAFSPEYVNAIEQKQIAEQEVERQRFLVQQAEQEALRVETEAEGQANAAIRRAEGEAEAIVLRAQAEAEALALINEQISQNENLITWRYIEQLGDNVQIIIIPSNSPFLFDFQSLVEEQPSIASEPTPTPTPTPSAPTEEDGGQETENQ